MTDEQDERADEQSQTDEQDEKPDYEKQIEKAKEEVKELEDEPPQKLEDWPTGKAKYETFGGPEGQHGYHEGPEAKLGPDSVRHRDDGSVEVSGEDADNPEEYKGEPVPGGPTDPSTPNTRMDKASPEDVSERTREAQEKDDESEPSETREGEGD